MRKEYHDYLIAQGYKLKTPSGNPSTVYDYQKRIDKVCEWEKCSWETLAKNIDKIVVIYDIGGDKENFGNSSHRSVINALKQFKKFVQK